MKFCLLLAAGVAIGSCVADALKDGFREPPRSALPQVWWHWMNGNVTKAGITADLESMKAMGIGGAHIFDIDYGIPPGPVAFNSPAWFDHVEFAAKEARRLGLELAVNTASGWSAAGGPWTARTNAMKYVEWRETFVSGPTKGPIAVPAPSLDIDYRDIAILAYPTPTDGDPAPVADLPLKTFRFSSPGMCKRLGPGIPPSPGGLVRRADTINLTERLLPDGTLRWEAPSGKWTILRIGYRPIARMNYPATAAGRGLECDKLSVRAFDAHFDAHMKPLMERLGPLAGDVASGVTAVLIDSYESKCQNWTDGFEDAFRREMGYAIHSYLPALIGRIVDSPDVTERFLRDYRRVIADLFSHNFGRRIVERCHAYGLKVYQEPYGDDMPADLLQFGEAADIPMTEFWCAGAGKTPWGPGQLSPSLAHVWGRRVVAAESFTTWPQDAGWRQDPYALKHWGDAAYIRGVNRIVYHSYVHQPWTDAHLYPGMTQGRFGVHFGRTVTWWPMCREWTRYQARCQWLLQEGTFCADVIAFMGDDAPVGCFGSNGAPGLKLAAGYSFDGCNREGLKALRVENGRIVSPGGVRYRLLFVGSPVTMELESLQAIGRLAEAGAMVVGRRPSRACGLRRYPMADADIAATAAAIWSRSNVVDSADVNAGIAALGLKPDFRCLTPSRDFRAIHRRYADGSEGWFVMQPSTNARSAACAFRISGRIPEFWDSETGRIVRAAEWKDEDGLTTLDIALRPRGSVFVMFRPKLTPGVAPNPARKELWSREITGPWSLSFPPGWNAPASIRLDRLVSWTERPEEGVRYFSGIAVYSNRIYMAGAHGAGIRLELDLGRVMNLCEVRVNGHVFPALWRPPFRLDVTEALVAGGDSATLEIRVANTWVNRLIGDQFKPEDCTWTDKSWNGPHLVEWPEWLRKGTPRTSGRLAFATWRHWTRDDLPLESGLFGPVVLRAFTRTDPR